MIRMQVALRRSPCRRSAARSTSRNSARATAERQGAVPPPLCFASGRPASPRTCRLPDRFGRPMVEALSVGCGGDDGGLVRCGIDAQRELAGKVLARIDAILGAGFKKHLQGNPAFMAQAIDILGMKIGATVTPCGVFPPCGLRREGRFRKPPCRHHWVLRQVARLAVQSTVRGVSRAIAVRKSDFDDRQDAIKRQRASAFAAMD